QLAKVVGISTEKLLSQMKSAGLPHDAEDAAVSDKEKQTLLAFLKKAHGAEDADAKPKKITLRKKSTSTLSTTGTIGSKGSSVVNVEVRKKRTFVKKKLDTNKEEDVVNPEVVEAKQATVKKSKAEILREAKQAADEASRKAEQEAHAREEAEKKRAEEEEALRKTQAKSKRATKVAKKVKKAPSKAQKFKVEPQLDPEQEAAKRREEEARRKKADEEARRKTLEEAARIASELETRGDQDADDSDDDYVAGDKLVQEAFEQ